MVQWCIEHKGRNIADLMKKDPAILRAYLRVMTRYLQAKGLLYEPAAPYHVKALKQLTDAYVKSPWTLKQVMKWYEMDFISRGT